MPIHKNFVDILEDTESIKELIKKGDQIIIKGLAEITTLEQLDFIIKSVNMYKNDKLGASKREDRESSKELFKKITQIKAIEKGFRDRLSEEEIFNTSGADRELFNICMKILKDPNKRIKKISYPEQGEILGVSQKTIQRYIKILKEQNKI